jgi:hypothetical protein
MKSKNNNNNDDDDDDNNNNNNNNNTAMGSVHARGRYIFNFWFKSAYRNEHLTPRHWRTASIIPDDNRQSFYAAVQPRRQL